MYHITATTQSKKELILILNAVEHFTDDTQVNRAAGAIRKQADRLADDQPFYAIVFSCTNTQLGTFNTVLNSFKTEREAVLFIIEHSVPENNQPAKITIKTK